MLQDRDEDERRAAQHLIDRHRDARQPEHAQRRRREIKKRRRRQQQIGRPGHLLERRPSLNTDGVVAPPRPPPLQRFPRKVDGQREDHAQKHAPGLEERVLEALLLAARADAAHRQQDFGAERAGRAGDERADEDEHFGEAAGDVGGGHGLLLGRLSGAARRGSLRAQAIACPWISGLLLRLRGGAENVTQRPRRRLRGVFESCVRFDGVSRADNLAPNAGWPL